MNEQLLKNLISNSQKVVGYTDGGYTEIKQLDPNVFAELIIKECAVIANRAENNDSELRCMYDVIVEHFGIKS